MSRKSKNNVQTLPYSLTDGFILKTCKVVYSTITRLLAPLIPHKIMVELVLSVIRFVYPCEISGLANVPADKGALIASNHISLIDGLLIRAALKRKVYFLISEKTRSNWFVKAWVKHFDCITLVTSQEIGQTIESLKLAAQKIKEGYLVCVFPEGHVSRTATVLPFRKGIKVILRYTEACIVPVYLDNLWGSIFSFCGGRFITRMPPVFRRKTTMVIGTPLPSSVSNADLRKAVVDLGPIAWQMRRKHEQPIHRMFIRTMRRRPFTQAFGDFNQPKVTRMAFLIKTIALTRAVNKIWKGQKNVGLMVPTTPAAAMLNIGASITGRTSVNLNFTAGKAAMKSAIRQAKIKTVITAKLVDSRFPGILPDSVEKHFIEDIARRISFLDKVSAVLIAIFMPISAIEELCGQEFAQNIDDALTIIFSSGSTGEPKGAVLSHFNLISNLRQTDQYLKLDTDDSILQILPVFHSFGYLAMWMIVGLGLPAVFHPNPLDAAAIGEICEKCKVTFFFATPTFAQLYLRKCRPEQLGSVKNLITGAEKLSQKTIEGYKERFGIVPREGYGTTECSPVVCISVENYRESGILQIGSIPGSVGQPLPGMSVKIIDPDNGRLLGFNQPGLLLVKGPNVMNGYLDLPQITAEVLKDGWYNTGDIATLDQDGFVKITDRLSRFSKIGGEMVPHVVVEEALQQASGEESRCFAVTGVPDDKKGEVLVVLYTIACERIGDILKQLGSAGLPNLFIPRREFFIKVDEMPVLGSGKMDLKRLKQIALEVFGPRNKFR
ncbi:MAG: acyl-[acyl-carrier-protein]-phospholipid O-acyltransferase [Clostridiales bacterium]|nr:acyl-[acyl-carrier-protein]-phospholipid O-acyltransferase [Clostridiales bacterium]MDN5282822.1 acyl-[acyl-carrier-protein]-phospholipid O-acyltransferase [Candidatus Ozemobacter sp.]